jgi:kumamolisin
MRRPHSSFCRPYVKIREQDTSVTQASASAASWSVPDLCAAYNWPKGLTGGGVIAIVELDGGWVQSDIDAYFQSINQPTPQITDISVNGARNKPNLHIGQTPDPDSEVAMDI